MYHILIIQDDLRYHEDIKLRRSKVTSFLGMVSLGLALIPEILLYSFVPEYSELIILGPSVLLCGLLVVPSVVSSYFELKTSKYNYANYYFTPKRDSVGRGLSLIYGLLFLCMGIIMPSIGFFYDSDSTFLIDFGFIYIGYLIGGILGIIGALIYKDSPIEETSNARFRKTKIGIIMIMLCSIMIVSSILFINTSLSYSRRINVYQDSYVYEYSPNTNYGNESNIYVGNHEFGKTEAYYEFDISDLEAGWKEAKLLVRFHFASLPVNIGASFVYDPWSEMNITWNNRPNRTALYGHIECDGFDFYVPAKPKHFNEDKITICLYGIGGVSDGYLTGMSKEGTSSEDNISFVYLEYEGIDPNFFIGYSIAYIVIIIIGLLFLISEKRSSASHFSFRSDIHRRRIAEIEEEIIRRAPVRNRRQILRPPEILLPPLDDLMRPVIYRPPNVPGFHQNFDNYRAREIYKINELVDLRLIGNKTYIYVNHKRLIVCTFLLINIPKDRVRDYDGVKSIDEAAEYLDKSLETSPAYFYKISPEEEFRAHCSNIQAFFENGLNTDILHSNIAFPLLKELVNQGFQPAIKVFKEEIARRFNEGTFNSRRFLYNEGYLSYLNQEEKQMLEGYDDFINKFLERSSATGHLFGRRLLDQQRLSLRELLTRAVELRICKIAVFGNRGVGKNTLRQRFSTPVGGQDTSLAIGVNLAIKNLKINNQNFKFQVWNLIPNRFVSLHSIFFRGVIGGIFIYDITDISSLIQLDDWLSSINFALRGQERFPIILVGNKLDLAEKRQVSVEQAIKFAKARGIIGYIECSFLTGKNAERIFKRMGKIILKKVDDNN